MLTQLTLKNFQRWQAKTITLGTGVNTLVGPNDAGKTAILRALRWVCLNQPDGLRPQTHGTKTTTVALTCDGVTVTRSRGPSKNTYAVDGAALVAFGREVPPEVSALVNVTNYNFATQHDSAFWLGLSPPELARQLNAVVDLGIIDTTATTTAKGHRQAKQAAQAAAAAVVAQRATVKRLAWTVAATQAADAVDDALTALTGTQAKLAALRSTYRAACIARDVVRSAQACVSDLATYRDRAGRVVKLGARVAKVAGCLADIDQADGLVLRGAFGPPGARLAKTWAPYQDTRQSRIKLEKKLEGARQAHRARQVCLTRRDNAITRFQRIAAKGCPLCGK